MLVCILQICERVVVVIGGCLLSDLPTFVPEFKLMKSQFPICLMGGGELLAYFPSFVPDFKTDKIPKFHMSGGQVVDLLSNFLLLDFKNDKFPKIPYVLWKSYWPTFQLLFLSLKTDKIPKSHMCWGKSYWPISKFCSWFQMINIWDKKGIAICARTILSPRSSGPPF